MMNCNLLLMASLSTMWTVVVGLLAVVTSRYTPRKTTWVPRHRKM